ncbi:MAG: hypothetical protein LC749_12385 [Actinobacteria bacterium]|nr:hypothetical protein [Actinomycetota bacterium]
MEAQAQPAGPPAAEARGTSRERGDPGRWWRKFRALPPAVQVGAWVVVAIVVVAVVGSSSPKSTMTVTAGPSTSPFREPRQPARRQRASRPTEGR